jgi:hypothetical protein
METAPKDLTSAPIPTKKGVLMDASAWLNWSAAPYSERDKAMYLARRIRHLVLLKIALLVAGGAAAQTPQSEPNTSNISGPIPIALPKMLPRGTVVRSGTTTFRWTPSSIVTANCGGDSPISCIVPAGADFGVTDPAYNCGPPENNGCYHIRGSDLYFNGPYILDGLKKPHYGYGIYSGTSFDPRGFLSIEASVFAYCGPDQGNRCFAGLVLYDGEADYRELAYENFDSSVGIIGVHRVGPKVDRQLIDSSTGMLLTKPQNSPHTLRLDYLGETNGAGGWVFYVDNIVEQISPNVSVDFDPFLSDADPRAALWLVADVVTADAKAGHYVEGHAGPITIYSGLTLDQSQPIQTASASVSSTNWIAQQVQKSNGPTNVSVVSLSLTQGLVYLIMAYEDSNGAPGRILNTTVYTARTTGIQDVPLWALFDPGPNRWWLVIRGAGSGFPPQSVGTTSTGARPYPGPCKTSGDGGSSWVKSDTNVTFQTYAR